MKRKFFAVLLVICIIAGLLPVNAFAAGYVIGSANGKNIANNMAPGSSYTCTDGSVWTKDASGNVSVSHGGQTFPQGNFGTGGSSTSGSSASTSSGGSSSASSGSAGAANIQLTQAQQEKCAMNSATWLLLDQDKAAAQASGDTARVEKIEKQQAELHKQNMDIIGSAGGSYNTETGNYSDASGNNLISINRSGGFVDVSYNTSANYNKTTVSAFSKETVKAYLEINGDTPETRNNLTQAYTQMGKSILEANKDAAARDDWNLDSIKQYLVQAGMEDLERMVEQQTMVEILMLQLTTGLTWTEVSSHYDNIIELKTNYNNLTKQCEDLKELGVSQDAPEFQALLAQMQQIADKAEAERAKYGYSATQKNQEGNVVNDGSAFEMNGAAHPGQITSGSGSGGGGNTNLTVKCKVTVTQTANGTISPGTSSYEMYSSPSFNITPDPGYKVKNIIVDGQKLSADTKYVFFMITENHTLSAEYELAPVLKIDKAEISCSQANKDGSIKAGYGVSANIHLDINEGVNRDTVKLTASYNFGKKPADAKTIELVSEGNDTWTFPVSGQGATNSNKLYIPVSTADGTYPIKITVTGKDKAGNAMAHEVTLKIVVKGTMYEDDFTGDRR